MALPDVFACWELIFRPAWDPPEEDTTVLASDGNEMELAYMFDGHWYRQHIHNSTPLTAWYGVIGWAYIPDPKECVKDLIEI